MKDCYRKVLQSTITIGAGISSNKENGQYTKREGP